MLKKVFLFTICLLPWFLNNIIPVDYKYYDKIKTPFFAPPQIFYPIAWTIIYILIAITVNQSYTLVFFGLKNNFLGFVSCLGTLISTLFLYEETSLLNNKISKILYAYILLSLFATILSLSIFFLNA